MKKYFFGLAALLLMTPLALVSCGDDEKDDNGTEKAPVTLKTPQHKDDAVKYLINQSAVFGNKVLKCIELTESGKYLVTYQDAVAATRAGEDILLHYLMGDYSVSGGSFNLSGFGVVSIDKTSAKLEMTITTSDGEKVTVPVTLSQSQVESLINTYLCRTWTIQSTRLRYPSGTATLAKEFQGCNMYEILNFARQYYDFSDEVSVNKIVRGVTITSAYTFLINYADDSYDVGSWSWNGTPSADLLSGGINYHWDADYMGNPMLNKAAASVEFIGGDQCKLTLKGTISGKSVEVVWTMKG